MTETIDELERSRQLRREAALRTLGIGAGAAASSNLSDELGRNGLSTYPLLVISALGAVDALHGWGFIVLAPEIGRSFGLSVGAIAGVLTLKNLLVAIAPLIAASLAQRPRRALLTVVNAFAWSLAGMFTAFAANIWGLLTASAIDGLTSGSSHALHTPLLMDLHPPTARVRALTSYQIGSSAANVIAPLLVALLTSVLFFSWRGVFLATGLLSLVVSCAAVRLRDPGFGTFDDDRIRTVVRRYAASVPDRRETSLGFFEILRRLTLIPTVRRLLIGHGVIGVMTAPLLTFLFFFLDDRWGMGPGARGLFLAFDFAVSIVALLAYGRRGENLFRENPGRVVELGGLCLAGAALLICIAAVTPLFVPMCVLFALAFALVAVLTPSLNVTTQTIVPARMRAHLAALNGIATASGGILGLIFFGGIESRYGISGSLVAVFVPAAIGALVIRSAAPFVQQDLDRMIDAVIEDEEVRAIEAAGGHLPLISCRGIDFYYGQLQVLFDIDFDVDEGEMVALLGVNGAGKSTLLKVLSGIGLPQRGTVRFGGHDITYLDAERRVPLGISQVPGGRAVFGPVSVVENLRTYGYTLGRDRAGLDRALDECFEVFPRLAERRNQSAATLSGGEQQMLALSKALILRPRVLLIDELSLGLAPAVVADLLDLVRRINAGGTAVVLVEQSVNIALELVHHAYFMEKGEIRFDGRAADLLCRDDLLRAVFLTGAEVATA